MTSSDNAAATPVRVRFAPSPTGALHLGGALVALANAAHVRSNGGVLVLRIDDTDVARSRDELTDGLIANLRRLGIAWDEGPIHQRDRAARHAAALDDLITRDAAYPCFCTDARLEELRQQQASRNEPPRYDGRCRSLDGAERQRAVDAGAPHVIRFAIPEGQSVVIDDLVKGRIEVPAGSFGDPVLRRTDGSIGYMLASVVDDSELAISLVIRGEDHLHNTARHLLLIEAIGATAPQFAHLPLLRDSDGKKLSKRDPLGTLDDLLDAGFLPRTIRRYLAELLGQGAVDLLGEDAPSFLMGNIPVGAPRVDRARLESLGREDVALLDTATLLDGMGASTIADAEPLVRELAAESATLVELRGSLRLVLDGPGPGDLPIIVRMAAGEEATDVFGPFDAALELAVQALREAPDDADPAELVAAFRALGSEQGMRPRELLQPLRLALTGMTGGPKLDLVIRALGRAEALRRVHLARIVVEDESVTSGDG